MIKKKKKKKKSYDKKVSLGTSLAIQRLRILLATYCITHGTLLNVTRRPGRERGLGENEYTHRLAESLGFHLKLAQHGLISYTPIQNKKFKVWREKKESALQYRSPGFYQRSGNSDPTRCGTTRPSCHS